MTASKLLARGHAFLRQNFPVSVTIAGQSYDAVTSGVTTSRPLDEGGYDRRARVSFWIPVAAFAAASKPTPKAQERVAWAGVAYAIDQVHIDPTGTTVILRCESIDQ